MKIIIIDDDPTGSQTVNDCNLILRWDYETLLKGLKDSSNLLFILVFITVENYYSLSMDSGSFVEFIAPGLIIMIVAQESYDNSSATLIHMKQIGSLDDWLMAPIYRIEILISLIFTSLIIGIILALFNFFIFTFLIDSEIYNFFYFFYYLF